MLLPEYIKSDYVAPVDLATTGKMFDTLQQRHDKAVETESQLRIAINEMDMNEAEDGFKQGLVDTINNMVAENVENYNGYKGYGLNDLIDATGKIMGSAAVKGRLEAQKAWKEHNAKLDQLVASNYINQDLADMYKELNPYSYEDTLDNNGNVIGGTRWTPNLDPVKQFDLNEVLDNARKYINPDSNVYGGTIMIDAEGKTTNDITKAIAFKNYDGSVQQITEDKIREALRAAYYSNADFQASLAQDYTLAKWYEQKYGEDVYNWHYPDGVEMSQDEYLDSKLEPFVQSYKTKQTAYKSSMKPNTAYGKGSGTGFGAALSNLLTKKQITPTTKGIIAVNQDFANDSKVIVDNENSRMDSTANSLEKFILDAGISVNVNE